MIKKTMRSILFIISITFSFGAMELSAQDSNLTPKKTKSKITSLSNILTISNRSSHSERKGQLSMPISRLLVMPDIK